MAARYSAMAADCAWHAKTTSLQVGTVAVALDARSEKIRCTILKSEVRTESPISVFRPQRASAASQVWRCSA